MIVPYLKPEPVWWPFLLSKTISSHELGVAGDKSVLLTPSKKGFITDKVGLRCPLRVVRLGF